MNIKMYEWRIGKLVDATINGPVGLIVDGDQSWFEVGVTVDGVEWPWYAQYNETKLRWESGD